MWYLLLLYPYFINLSVMIINLLSSSDAPSDEFISLEENFNEHIFLVILCEHSIRKVLLAQHNKSS